MQARCSALAVLGVRQSLSLMAPARLASTRAYRGQLYSTTTNVESELARVRKEIIANKEKVDEMIAAFEAATDPVQKELYAAARGDVSKDILRLRTRESELVDAMLARREQYATWNRRRDLDQFAAEVVELHQTCCALENDWDAEGLHEKVQHAGHGVLVQEPSIAIDKDSQDSKNNAVITRIEQRSVARHAIEAANERRHIIVVGDPGTGKTRGSMFFAMQELLAANKTVMRVGFKESQIILFEPNNNEGKYEVWTRQGADAWHDTDLARDREVFVLIDPPERGDYADMARCCTIKFAPTDEEQHYKNAEKDKIVLVTGPPTKEELCAMIPTLWTADTAPGNNFDSLESKKKEILQRALLVGCAPRYVFGERKFLERARSVKAVAERTVEEDCTRQNSVVDILNFYAQKKISSICFTIAPTLGGGDLTTTTWRDRHGNHAIASMHNLARLSIHPFVVEELQRADESFLHSFFIPMFRRDVCTFVLSVLPFEWEPGRPLDALELGRTVTNYRGTEQFLKALKNHDNDGLMCVESSSSSSKFPVFIDFAYGPTLWFKVEGAKNNELESEAVLRLLEGIGVVEMCGQGGEWQTVRGKESFKATMVFLYVVPPLPPPTPRRTIITPEYYEDLINRHVEVKYWCLVDIFEEVTKKVKDIAKNYKIGEFLFWPRRQ
ncbi:hypothetical protein CTAYLR_007706 [Chrysophaeum taylorii]|uniref:Uncharacterized protein n=1 Tax=Chrysophaeum taylorii TaxID=2483200 RepID=A0AAD7UCA1_9STRA|nr:hypothetical protein CTAYLR_007706 [Chrysophaeum taylorii]